MDKNNAPQNGDNKPNKKRKLTRSQKNEIIRKIVIFILSFACIFFLLQVGYNTYIGWKEEELAKAAKEAYEKAKEEATPTPKPTPTPTPEPTEEAVAMPTPIPKREAIVRPEFEALMTQYDNEDIVGYLKIEDTVIDYPVLQSEDNDFYLNRDIYKKNNIAGSIFLDFENDIDGDDQNTIIYGHNMNQDIMFHSLRYYSNKSFYDEHKYISFSTLYDDFVYEVFAFYVPSTSFPYIYANYQNDSFAKLLEKIKEMATYDTEVEVDETDRIIHLSTCSNAAESTRFAIVGKLVEVNGRDYEEIKAEKVAYEEALAEYEEYIANNPKTTSGQ